MKFKSSIDLIESIIVRVCNQQDQVVGTGFWVLPNGFILTCHHVIVEACPKGRYDSIRVQLQNASTTIVAEYRQDLSHPASDFAVLWIDPKEVERIEFPLLDQSSNQELDRDVIIYGFRNNLPNGYRLEAKLRQGQRMEVGEVFNLVDISLPPRSSIHGMSGAPVFDKARGVVVGLLYAQETEGPSTCYVHPITKVYQIWKELKILNCSEASLCDIHQNEIESWFLYQDEKMISQLRMDLNIDSSILITESPLSEIWNEFLGSINWHIRIQRHLDDIESKIHEFPETFELLDKLSKVSLSSLRYDEIVLDMIPIINECLPSLSRFQDKAHKEMDHQGIQSSGDIHDDYLGNLRKSIGMLVALKRYLENPLFQKCFLITGSMGSGKSYFIYWLVEESLRTKDFLVLILQPETYKADKDLLTYILDQIELYCHRSWSSLNQVNECLERSTRYFNNERSSMKLIIVMDDIQRWINIEPQIIQKISNIISYTTNLHSIFWVITTPDRCVDSLVLQNRVFWKRYSLVKSINRHVEEGNHPHQPKRSWLNQDLNQIRVVNISGWIDLDNINLLAETGFSLIEENLKNRNDEESLKWIDEHRYWLTSSQGNLEQTNQRLARYWSNPFIACVILDVCIHEHTPIRNLIDFSFIEFIGVYWRRKLSSLDLHSLSMLITQEGLISDATLAAKGTLDKVTHLIARYFANTGLFAPLEKDVSKYICDTTRPEAKILLYVAEERVPFLVHECITRLENIGMLKVTQSIDNTFGLDTYRIHILFEPFWMWRLAQEFMCSGFITEQLKDKTTEALDGMASHFSDNDFKDAFLEFFLLLLGVKERSNNLAKEFVTYLWCLGFNDKNLSPRSIWFAACRADLDIQALIAGTTSGHSDLIPLLADRHNFFAFMYFVRESLPDVISTPCRIRLLKPHYQKISDHRLSDYYLYTFQQHILAIQDSDTLLECMIMLDGCEVMEITSALAWLCIESIKAIGKDDINCITNLVIAYLQQCSPHSMINENDNRDSHQWRFHLRLWIMHYYCSYLVEENLLASAFEYLREQGWYDAFRKLGIHSSIDFEMKKEANLSLGYGYRGADDQDRREFIDLISHLTELKNPRTLETAFFLIRHTKPTKRENAVRVDPIFQPYLEKIFMYIHPITNRIAEHFSEMFRVNLSNYDQLLVRRKLLNSRLRTRSYRRR